jgi:hypothetical protein
MVDPVVLGPFLVRVAMKIRRKTTKMLSQRLPIRSSTVATSQNRLCDQKKPYYRRQFENPSGRAIGGRKGGAKVSRHKLSAYVTKVFTFS